MSAKSSKPAKKLIVPRSLEEIQTEYSQLCASVGQANYKFFIESRNHETSVKNLMARLEAINNEAAARNKLDSEAKVNEAAAVAKES